MSQTLWVLYNPTNRGCVKDGSGSVCHYPSFEVAELNRLLFFGFGDPAEFQAITAEDALQRIKESCAN